jgi:hypothetical protein
MPRFGSVLKGSVAKIILGKPLIPGIASTTRRGTVAWVNEALKQTLHLPPEKRPAPNLPAGAVRSHLPGGTRPARGGEADGGSNRKAAVRVG